MSGRDDGATSGNTRRDAAMGRGWIHADPRSAAAVAAFGTAIVAAGTLFVLNGTHRPYPWINHDVAFLTYAGREILDGARLYVDFQEMNPPGSHFLYGALLALARAAGVPVFPVVHLFVLALAVAGWGLLAATFADKENRGTFLLVSLALGLVAVRGNFSNNVAPSAPTIPYDFGQREHLFSLLFLPYVLWRLTSDRVGRAAYPYLALTGFCAAFKPYWPILVLSVEGYVLLRRRRPFWGVYTAIGSGALLPCAVLLLHSREAFREFFAGVVPLMLIGGYARYGMGLSDFLGSPLHLEMLVGGAVFLAGWVACLRGRNVDRGALWMMLGVTASAYLIVLLQGKYWSYHGMVYFAAVAMLGAYCWSRSLAGLRQDRVRAVATVGAALLLLGALAASMASLRWMLANYPPKGLEVVPLVEGRGKVMFLSMASDYAYAPLVTGIKTVGPWQEHFRIPIMLEIADPARRKAALDGYAREIAGWIRRGAPELLLFAPYRLGLPDGVHIHDILSRHGTIPGDSYERVPDNLVMARSPRASGWIVYRRLDVPAFGGESEVGASPAGLREGTQRQPRGRT